MFVKIFKGLETGDGEAFFKHVADGVDWMVMGTHPLTGKYLSKRAFQQATFGKLSKLLSIRAQLRVTDVITRRTWRWSNLLPTRPRAIECTSTTTIAGSYASKRVASSRSVPTSTLRWSRNCFGRIRFDADQGRAPYDSARIVPSVKRSMTAFGMIRPKLMAKMTIMAVMPSDVVA